jgi:hypothetical protein
MDMLNTRVYIMGLLVDCPYESNSPDCALPTILHDIRKKSLQERVDWCNQLPDEEIQNIISTHKKCLACRESNNKVVDE